MLNPLPLQHKRIVVTRPIHQNAILCERIGQLGGTAIMFPLLTISPLPDTHAMDAKLAELDTYDWLVFTSVNAVSYGMARIHTLYPHKTDISKHWSIAAIGPSTANALLAKGATQVHVPQNHFDSEGLLDLPAWQAVTRQNIMLFCGIGGRDLLEKTLKARGAQVTRLECYQRTSAQSSADVLYQHHCQQACDAIIVTSSEALRYLLPLLQQHPALLSIPLLANHARIAKEAQAIANLPCHYPEQGSDDDAMMDCLIQFFQRHAP